MGKEPARSSFSDDGSRIVSKRQQLHVLSSWRETVRLLGEDQPDRLSQITEAASSPSGSSFIFSHLAGRRLSFGRRTAADRLSHMTESASSLNGNRFIFSHLAGRRFVSGGGQPQPNRLSQIGIGRGGGGTIESGWAEWAGGDGQPVDIGRAKVTVDMILVLSSKRMRKAIPGEEASPVRIPDRGSPEEVFAQDRLCGRQCHRPGRSLLDSENVECSVIGGGGVFAFSECIGCFDHWVVWMFRVPSRVRKFGLGQAWFRNLGVFGAVGRGCTFDLGWMWGRGVFRVRKFRAVRAGPRPSLGAIGRGFGFGVKQCAWVGGRLRTSGPSGQLATLAGHA